MLIIGFAIIIIAALQMETVKNRMAELSSGSGMENFEIISSGGAIDVFDNKKYNGTSLRLSLWYLGIDELIERDRLLIGLSPADRRAIMNQRYYEVGMGPYKNYNLHNQFIQTLVELGIIGLALYLLVYIALFGLSWHRSNHLLLVFLMATLIFQLTESILERNKVIVFIMFFYCLLATLKYHTENEGRNTGN
jgi:O-antigen ligase